MAETSFPAAVAGFGAQLGYAVTGTTYTDITLMTEITPPEISVDSIDVTNHDSTGGAREFIGGLSDGGEATANFIYNKTPYAALLTIAKTRANIHWKYTAPPGDATTPSTCLFDGHITKLGNPGLIDGALVCPMTIKVTGVIAVTTGS